MFGESDGEDEVGPVSVIDTKARDDFLHERPENCGVLSFHAGTEEAMLLYVQKNAVAGDPDSVLSAVDAFCYQRHWMMHIGDFKGQHLDTTVTDVLSQKKNIIAMEVGSYCGYSAVRIARFLTSESHLFCVENNKHCVSFTRRLLTHAGLQDKVTVIEGTVAEGMHALRSRNLFIDLLFLDHAKELYLSDLRQIEASGLLNSGAYVVADNVLCFNAPLDDYLHHVRNSGLYASSLLVKGPLEYSTVVESVDEGSYLEDGLEISVYR